MARGRIISPDFWTDGKMITLSPFARLFYIGLWNFATCDKGHLPDDAVGLKLKILPADNIDASKLLAELMDAGRVIRVEIAGEQFLQVPTFERHQSGSRDSRWKTRCPACRLMETLESFPEHSSALPNSRNHKEEGRGGEASESEGGAPTPGINSPFCSAHPNGTDQPCRPCGDARRRYDGGTRTAVDRAPDVGRYSECPRHPGWPHPESHAGCDRCREIEQEAAA